MNIYKNTLLVLLLTLSIHCEKTYLKPQFAHLIPDLGEPSGIAFCPSTNSLWIISDSDQFIFETDLEGNCKNQWSIPKHTHSDLEGISCDDENKFIHIVEEGKMRISSFILPRIDNVTSYEEADGNYNLILENQIQVYYPNDFLARKPKLGIEGFTWVSTSQSFVVSNEKKPAAISPISDDGEILQIEMPNYAGDISDLAYDEAEGAMWVLSDESQRLLLTDVSGETIIDYWDLEMEHPEGITVNNEVNPAKLYIVTDPSSPHGDPYVPAIFVFTKPAVGTGHKGKFPLEPVHCEGCESVWEAAAEVHSPSSDSSGTSSSSEWLSSVEIILLILCSFLLCCIIYQFFMLAIVGYWVFSGNQYSKVQSYEINV